MRLDKQLLRHEIDQDGRAEREQRREGHPAQAAQYHRARDGAHSE